MPWPRPALFLLALALAAPARAEEAGARLTFAVYSKGLEVLEIDSRAELGASSYRVDFNYHTTGLLGTLFPSRIESFSQGDWNAGNPRPVRFATWGTVRGTERRTVLDYVAGQPMIRTLVPENDLDRDVVPAELRRDSVDTLSAMAFLVRRVADTGACDGSTRIFDGRRVIDIDVRTSGEERLAADYRSIFAGPALRCDLRSRQLAGFPHNESAAERTRVRDSTAWLAAVLPGEPRLPVRADFELRLIGRSTAYLSAAGPAPPAPR